MIDTKEYGEAIAEVIEILQNMDDYYIEKIPLEFIRSLKEKKSPTYEPKIDFTKELNENELKHQTKVILALIYLDYLCETEEEKKEFRRLLKNPQENTTDIFNKDVIQDENLDLIPFEEKKSLFQKILNKIFKRR